MNCPYRPHDAPFHQRCDAPADHLVEHLKGPRLGLATYCLKHAAHEVNRGARWVCSHRHPCLDCMKKRIRLGRWPDPMGGVEITYCERDRISADGP